MARSEAPLESAGPGLSVGSRKAHAAELLVDALGLAPVERRLDLLMGQVLDRSARLSAVAGQPEEKLAIEELTALLDAGERLKVIPAESLARMRARLKRLGATEPATVSSTPTQPLTGNRRRTTSSAPVPQLENCLLIDGSNFLGRARGYALGDDPSRERLLMRLQDFCRRHPAHQVFVFFDGIKVGVRKIGNLEIRFTGGQRPADDVLLDQLRSFPDPIRPRCLVISDDKDLANRSKLEGGVVHGVAWLEGRLGRRESPGEPSETVSGGGVDDWLTFFERPPNRPGRK